MAVSSSGFAKVTNREKKNNLTYKCYFINLLCVFLALDLSVLSNKENIYVHFLHAENQENRSQIDQLVGFTLKLALTFALRLDREALEVTRRSHCHHLR